MGIGTGRFAVPLAIKYGIESCKRMRDIAITKGIDVIDGVAEDLPLDNDSFDYVLMITTICFLDDIEKALSEAYRIIRKIGGKNANI